MCCSKAGYPLCDTLPKRSSKGLRMQLRRAFRILVCAVSAFVFGFALRPCVAQAGFAGRTMQATVGNGNAGGSGTLKLASAGVGFDSPDFVFSLPVDDITAVEFSGTREAYLTLVLDQQSKFPRAYPTLVRTRFNSIGQEERLVTLGLQPREPMDPAVANARQFQAFVRAHRAEREQASVGAAASDAAHPSFGKTLHVALQNKDGLLTFFPDHLQYDNPDVSIHLGLADMAGAAAAGARETFFSVEVRPGPLQKAYQGYERSEFTNTFHYFLPFVLVPSEPVAPAFRLAQDYAEYLDNVRAGREQADVQGNAGTAVGVAPPLPASASPSGSAAKRELNRFDAAFLERHNPSSKLVNSFKPILGTAGTLIVFDTGIGYVSLNRPTNLKASRLPYLEDGYLKFFVPGEAIQSARDVSVIRNTTGGEANNTYIAEISVDRSSAFYAQHRALMAESDADNRLFFVFKSRGALAAYLGLAPHAVGGRDQF